MSVSLVAITQPIIKHSSETIPGSFEGYGLKRNLSADEFIAYTARVSNPANQMNTETAGKLIKYLIKNNHWSPFEMVSLTMEIHTTRDIGRQILRHRSFSFQEFSQRYAKATEFTTREARLQDNKNRQNSIDTDDDKLRSEWYANINKVAQLSAEVYQWALDNGIAKEQARVVLPEGMTMSTLYMSGTLRSWIHYCDLRCANGTQKEHKQIAEQARGILIDNFPSLGDHFGIHSAELSDATS